MMKNKIVNSRRNLNGVLLLDKPIGLSSNAALQRVKRIFNAKKAGHTGSLDPLATGMLPICFGRATKFCQYLLDADKSYEVGFQLGIKTTTGDTEGEVISRCEVPVITESLLETVLDKFRGDILQVPPMYSALKHKGRPLYEYARKGIVIERPQRKVTISQLSCIEFSRDVVRCAVSCSKGTYIRTLVEDIGEELNCGAVVTQLHRSSVADFNTCEMVSLPEIQDQKDSGVGCIDLHVLPTSRVVSHMPRYIIGSNQLFTFSQKKPIQLISVLQPSTLVAVYLEDSHFVGVASTSEDGRVLKCKTMSLMDRAV